MRNVHDDLMFTCFGIIGICIAVTMAAILQCCSIVHWRTLLCMNILYTVVGITLIVLQANVGMLPYVGSTPWITGASCLLAVIMYAIMYRHQRRQMMASIRPLEGDLPECVLDGTIRFLDVQWLRANSCSIVRHQELPPEALLSPEDARTALHTWRVGALSYRWLSREAPDPTGFHADALARAFVDLPQMHKLQALFIDYSALPQRAPDGTERTDEESARFKRGLGVMAGLYASPRVTVLQHARISPEAAAAGAVPYDRSGWCQFETSVASLTKSFQKIRPIGTTRQQDGLRWWVDRLIREARAGRCGGPRPIRGKAVTQLLRDEHRTVFYGSADRMMVAKLYRDLYERMVSFDEQSVQCTVRLAEANVKTCYGRVRFALVAAVAIGSLTVLVMLLQPRARLPPHVATSMRALAIGSASLSLIAMCLLPSRSLMERLRRTATLEFDYEETEGFSPMPSRKPSRAPSPKEETTTPSEEGAPSDAVHMHVDIAPAPALQAAAPVVLAAVENKLLSA